MSKFKTCVLRYSSHIMRKRRQQQLIYKVIIINNKAVQKYYSLCNVPISFSKIPNPTFSGNLISMGKIIRISISKPHDIKIGLINKKLKSKSPITFLLYIQRFLILRGYFHFRPIFKKMYEIAGHQLFTKA